MNARNPIDGDRRTHMTDAVGTTAWRYDEAGRLVGESGPFGTPEVQVAYDPNGRLTNVTWGTFSVDYSFDDLGRIVSVAAPEGTYAFTYLSNGLRRATVAYPNGVSEVRAHDALARCTSLAFLSGTNPLLSIAYAYDDGDRRTNEVWSTGRAMAYGYDDAHQLTSVAATRPSDAARYRYDAAGNPVDRAELGLDVTNSFNNLNQIVTGSWTGATLTVAGTVNYPVGSISVNGQPGTVYPDSTFDVAAVPVVPGTNTLTATYIGPAYTNAPMTATDTSTVVLGDTLYSHDANGNLTSDATFTYQYDLANQLTNVIRKSDSVSVLQCRYDAIGRRVEAIRSDGTVDRYIYFPASFLVLAVLDETNTPKELYTRGPDLSGTFASAGGIGGILACTYASSLAAPLYHHADLMGNIIALTEASGELFCKFHYTSFGQLVFHMGSMLPRHLFSSKEFDFSVGFYHYGYRCYNPRFARWIARDLIPETGRKILYRAFENTPLQYIDCWGLEDFDPCRCVKFLFFYQNFRKQLSDGSYTFPMFVGQNPILEKETEIHVGKVGAHLWIQAVSQETDEKCKCKLITVNGTQGVPRYPYTPVILIKSPGRRTKDSDRAPVALWTVTKPVGPNIQRLQVFGGSQYTFHDTYPFPEDTYVIKRGMTVSVELYMRDEFGTNMLAPCGVRSFTIRED